MGGAVGSTTNTLMKGKDLVYLFGGKQDGEDYTSSNKVYKIDFSNSSMPKIEELPNMKFLDQMLILQSCLMEKFLLMVAKHTMTKNLAFSSLKFIT